MFFFFNPLSFSLKIQRTYEVSKCVSVPLLQESAVSALAALCNEFYINERGEADPALQGNDSCLT